MTNIIIPGYTTEGTTDNRFLESIIQRSFEFIALECESEFEVMQLQLLKKRNGEFIKKVKEYAIEADQKGLMVLCVHVDADYCDDSIAFKNLITPAFDAIKNDASIYFKNLVAIVPVQMTEAWMLADIPLLKREILTNKSNIDLGLDKRPENINNPKYLIENALRLARMDIPQRRRYDLNISDLYAPIGQKIDLNNLAKLPSFQKFLDGIRYAFNILNYH